MSDEARRFVRSHPDLAGALERSRAFAAMRDASALEIDGERQYIVGGDRLGDEEELFLEALVRGAQSADPASPDRALYLELEGPVRALIDRRIEEAGTRPRPDHPSGPESPGARR